jgi:hypothetical protein
MPAKIPTLIRRLVCCVRWKMNRGIQNRSSFTRHIPIESAMRYGDAATSSRSGKRSARSVAGIESPNCSSPETTNSSAGADTGAFAIGEGVAG